MDASERRAGYLDDLGRLLQELTPVERIGVIDHVRERIDKAAARLGHEPSGEEMGGILAGVGAVEDVAQEAVAARSVSATQSPGPGAGPVVPEHLDASDATDLESEATEQPVAAAVGQAEKQADEPIAPAAPEITKPQRYDLSSIPAMEWPEDVAPRPGLTKRWVMLIALPLIGLGAFFLLFLLPGLALIIGVAVLWISPLWTRQERVIGTLVPVLGLGGFLPLLALGSGADGSPGLLLLALVLAVSGIAALIWLAVRGSKAVRRVDAEMAANAPRR